MKKTIRSLSTFLIAFCLAASVFCAGAADVTFYNGDVNMDGRIFADDARLALRASAKLENLSDSQRILADANSDGQLTADDARQILRYSAGLQNGFYGVITADEDQVNAALPQIRAFFERRCYYEGTLFENGETSRFAMAFDGEDYEVLTEIDGIEISVMRIKDRFYLKRPSTMQYIEMSETLLDTLGLSVNDMDIDLGSVDFDKQVPESVYDVDIGGVNGVCFIYRSGAGRAEFYAIDGELVEIIQTDSTQLYPTAMMIDRFLTTLPDGQLSLNGYTKAKSLFSMLSDIMQEE